MNRLVSSNHNAYLTATEIMLQYVYKRKGHELWHRDTCLCFLTETLVPMSCFWLEPSDRWSETKWAGECVSTTTARMTTTRAYQLPYLLYPVKTGSEDCVLQSSYHPLQSIKQWKWVPSIGMLKNTISESEAHCLPRCETMYLAYICWCKCPLKTLNIRLQGSTLLFTLCTHLFIVHTQISVHRWQLHISAQKKTRY